MQPTNFSDTAFPRRLESLGCEPKNKGLFVSAELDPNGPEAGGACTPSTVRTMTCLFFKTEINKIEKKNKMVHM